MRLEFSTARVISSILLGVAVQASVTASSPLENTQLLTGEHDFAEEIVAGVDRFLLRQTADAPAKRAAFWNRDFSSSAAYEKSLAPNRRRLAQILGVCDARIPFDALKLVATTNRPAIVARGENFEVLAVRWPALGDVEGEGLLLRPTGREPIAFVVALPDCSVSPEQLVGLAPGVSDDSQYPRRLAESGCEVIVPYLIDRENRIDTISNREWLYRSAYELGRGMIGYEAQKTLACIDWFAKRASDKSQPQGIGVIGWGEGGLLALYCGALDPRISAVCVSGYFQNRSTLWQEPADRNVFGLLEQFGDAELASMIAARALIVEVGASPECTIPAGGRGSPGRIATPSLDNVQQEVRRSRQMSKGLTDPGVFDVIVSGDDGQGPFGTDNALLSFLEQLRPDAELASDGAQVELLTTLPDNLKRRNRQIHQLDRHNQALLAESKYVRQGFFWDKLKYDSLDAYQDSIKPFRNYFAEEVIGTFDIDPSPPNPRSRQIAESDRWIRYEIVLDVFPDVIAYGILTVPRSIQPGSKCPVVVCQHGLEGRPQDVIGESQLEYYKAFATTLAERGYITFAPQNLYRGQDRFRTLQRKATPLKKTLFSIMVPQHQQIVSWLKTLPEVDPDRMAFYGLSYGGKTAMRVPPLVPGYCLSICSGDFNEWIDKVASSRAPYSYIPTGEYEIFEFNLGNTFNYAEMAALICPRPFMVERGHFDAVGDDQMVGAEYAKVRHLYAARLKIPDRTEIEWFAGPHTINGQGAFEFLDKHLERSQHDK